MTICVCVYFSSISFWPLLPGSLRWESNLADWSTLDRRRSGAQRSGSAGDGFQPPHEIPLDACGVAQLVPWSAVPCHWRPRQPTHTFQRIQVLLVNVLQEPQWLNWSLRSLTGKQNVCSSACWPDPKSYKQKRNRTMRYIQCDWIPAPGEKKQNTIKQPTKNNQTHMCFLFHTWNYEVVGKLKSQLLNLPLPNSMQNMDTITASPPISWALGAESTPTGSSKSWP